MTAAAAVKLQMIIFVETITKRFFSAEKSQLGCSTFLHASVEEKIQVITAFIIQKSLLQMPQLC